MLNKLKNIPLFWKIWICHIFIYFELLAFYIKDYNSINGIFDLIKLFIIAPLIGLFGFGIFDGIGLLVFFSVWFSYLINLYFKKTFLSYVLSLALTYPVFMYYCNEASGSNKLTVICLLITAIINAIIFRKNIFKNKEV